MGRLHAPTIFLGAFLLFQVQPLLTKWILPWFGGGPEVWTTCALFFQAALFAGYAYAHGIARLPGPVHLVLVAAALLTLPVAPEDRWRHAGLHPTLHILRMLAATVGLPFLLVSSTGPLVQAWFARAYPDRSPYRLYALSNAGSLAALLSYPLLVEPRLGLGMQSTIWTWAFAALAALHAAGAIAVPRAAPAAAGGEEEPPPSAGRRVAWIVLPAFASAMLLATTAQLTQDVAVVPFLWVLPLAVYLGSFIVAFDKPERVRPEILAPVAVMLSFAAALAYYLQPRSTPGILAGIGASLALLFAIGLLCHGAAAALKPEARRLTGFYLCVAGGGALGGLFAGVVAPAIFSTLFEWKLGLGITTLAAGAATAWAWRGLLRAHLNLAAGLLVTVGVGFAFQSALLANYGERLESSRNFYGVTSVERSSRRDASQTDTNDLVHGRVLHGRQFVDERHRRRPLTYYVEKSGIGRALEFFRARPDLKVGGVGLGAGTIAAYAVHPSQTFRFYEINPDMERIARTHFTYLRDCPGRAEVVLGDGRLSLEREEPRGFHVLALDAFAGHSVPVHLLTAEAMKSYARHLAPDGAVAVHVSNHLLDLAPVVRGAARAAGLATVRIDHRPDEKEAGASPSVWMICTRNEALIRAMSAHASAADERPEVTWTDDASDLFSILKRR